MDSLYEKLFIPTFNICSLLIFSVGGDFVADLIVALTLADGDTETLLGGVLALVDCNTEKILRTRMWQNAMNVSRAWQDLLLEMTGDATDPGHAI